MGCVFEGLERWGIVKSRWRTLKLQELKGKWVRRAYGESERVEGRWNKQRRESEGEIGEQAWKVSEANDLI